MSGAGIVFDLLDRFVLKPQEEEQKRAARQEAINRAAATLMYDGANPTEQDLQSRLHGGGPDVATLSQPQKQALNQHYADLAAAEDRNRGLVDEYRKQTLLDHANTLGAGPDAKTFQEVALRAKLPAILGRLSTRQQADVLNNKALGDPYTLQGGVMGNTETGQISDTSDAVGALAKLRQSQAESEANRRALLDAQAQKEQAAAGFANARSESEANRRALMDARAGQAESQNYLNSAKRQDLFDRIDASQKYFETRDPRYLERATGKPFPGVGSVVKGQVDGKTQQFRTEVDASGKVRYVPVQDDQGRAIQPEAEKGRGPTTLERNNQYLQELTGAAPDEVMQYQQNKLASPRDFEKLKQSGMNRLINQAQEAVRMGKDPDAVREILRRKGIDPAKAGL